MTTLGLTNFGSLTAPIQPLSDFDNILGNESSATQGAGLIGYNSALNYVAGSIGAAIQGAVNPVSGLVGDRVTLNTTVLQNAINATLLVTVPMAGGGCPTIALPYGAFLTGSLTINGRLKIQGQGSGSTSLVLAAGQTTSLLTFVAINTGSSLDDSSHAIVIGMTLEGNRVDSVTTGTSHGIECPDTSWTITTHYSCSIITDDLIILNFTGDGIFLGTNRNWALCSNTIVRYCNDNAIANFGYDSRFINCDFGECKNFGVRLFAGGGIVFTACNIYGNTINAVINNSVNSYVIFDGCAFDFALQNGISVSSPSCVVRIIGGRCYGNSASGANLYSDILVTGLQNETFLTVAEHEFTFANQKTKYLVETGQNPTVIFANNQYCRNTANGGVVPYQSGITNTPALLESSDQLFANALLYGVVGDATTDDGPQINNVNLAFAGTGRKLFYPYATYKSTVQIVFDRLQLWGDNATFSFVGLGAGVDGLVMQGSSMLNRASVDGINVNMNNSGRHGFAVAGGSAAYTSCDHASVKNMLIYGAVGSGVSVEPSAAFNWVQNLTFEHVKVLSSGGHSWRFKCGQANTFINNLLFNMCETRGAGQTTAGSADIYVELAGSTTSQQISSFVWNVFEADASGAANHGQFSILVNQTGTNGVAVGWTFNSPIFEDTGSVITGFPSVVSITGTTPLLLGWSYAGWDGNKYGVFSDRTKMPFSGHAAAGNRDASQNDTGSIGFAASYSNDAAAAAAGVPIGGFYRTVNAVQVRLA